MSKTISVPLSVEGIDQLNNELGKYIVSMYDKSRSLCYRLAEVGVEVGIANVGKYSQFISFRKRIMDGRKIGYLIIAESEPLEVTWYTDSKATNEKTNTINPILMAEFGSGFMATNPWEYPGVGQGTLPNAEGHAKDPKGWYWYEGDGNKYHSIGEPASQPLRKAWNEMLLTVREIAREEFSK